jgi:hypothetical protein
MKKQHIGFALFAMLCIVLSFAFTPSNEAVKAKEAVEAESTTSNSVIFAPTASTGTSTNTELDTITLASALTSKWTGCIQLTTTSTSGTRSQKVLIYETNVRAGTGYILVDSTTATTASIAAVRKVVEVYGQRQMFVVKSTGTQVSPYSLQLVYKKY